MKGKNRLTASILCLLMGVLIVIGLTGCNKNGECVHQWGEWTVISAAACEKEGTMERECSLCGLTERTESEALGHDWQEATCTTPKTCGRCSAVEGEALAHSYTLESVKDEALKTAASCQSSAVYYKSCVCGAVSTNDADTFTSGTPSAHTYTVEAVKDEALKTAASCQSAAVYYKSCTCGAVSTSDADTFTSGVYGHAYTVETVKDEALKTAANCQSAAVYYKSCVCGAVSANDSDTFSVGEPTDHVYDQKIVKAEALKASADSTGKAVYYKSCVCGKVSQNDEDTFNVALHMVHVYDRETVNNHTLKLPATCQSAAVYYRSCSCGDISRNDADTFTVGNPLNHSYDQELVNDAALKSGATCQSGAVYFRSCTCGKVSTNDADTFTSGTALPHTYDRETVKDEALKTEASCQSAAIYYKSCVCGAVSTSDADTFTVDSPSEHSFNQNIVKPEAKKSDATCRSAAIYYKSCTCGAISTNEAETFTNGSAASHSYSLISSTEADCENPAKDTYRCDVCSDEYTEDIGSAKGHDISGVTPAERQLEGCEYALIYVCKRIDCGKEVEGVHVFHHSYVASITKAATCQTDGEKTLTCSCGDTKPETIEKDETGHNWVKGTPSGGVRIDECSYCHQTKEVKVYEGTTTGATNTNDLKNTELELNDANISLDNGVIDTIGEKNITVSADKVEGDDREGLGLSAEELLQVGDSPIYNFTINDGTSNISQFGENNYVTITLPYTLSVGEDVDSIAVWFITDEGGLESIKATYNNGYVTFKTNHFSYYTVTKLTAEQKCELYGHSETVQNFEGSCTEDAYKLYVCDCCHASRKEIVKEAIGHVYNTPVTTNATCTEDGKIEYTCNACDHSYQTKLNATGHSYTVAEEQTATCSENGYKKYVCENCGDEYTETYDKAAHDYEDTVVDAACEAEGYTLHQCKNCEYSYKDNYKTALGHDYATEAWEWAGDHSSATLTLTCSRDSEHTVVLNANIGSTVVHGTCSNFSKTTYTAAVTYNGNIHTDEKTVESGTPDHKYSEEWKYNDNNHWRECVCGEKSDVEAHTFVGGSCKVCGMEELACDHTMTNQDYIDLGELGACDYILTYRTCRCGEVKETYIHELLVPCFFDITEENSYTDENGNLVMLMKGVCEDCGMEMSRRLVVEKTTCITRFTYYYTYTLNGETVIENLIAEDSRGQHHNVLQTIELSEYGICGGSLQIRTCSDCGVIFNFNYNIVCNIDYDTAYEEVTDENGVVHSVRTMECPDCDFKLVEDSWSETISACRAVNYMTYGFFCGDSEIYTRKLGRLSSNHQLETTTEMLGDTCDDGYVATTRCSICGVAYTTRGKGHYLTDNEYYDLLEDYGIPCGGYIREEKCIFCGVTTLVDGSEYCRFEYKGDNEDGYSVYECIDCGTVKYESVELESIDGSCSKMVSASIIYFVDGEEALRFESSYPVELHQNDRYSYEFSYLTCEDGYVEKAHCAVCGKNTASYNYDHKYETETVDLSEYIPCGGTIEHIYCVVCNEKSFNWYNEGCNWGRGRYENGIYVYECQTCHATKKISLVDGEIDENCRFTRTETRVYLINGEEVFRYIGTSALISHDYEYTYTLKGETCEDGVTVNGVCKKCGSTQSYETEGHQIERRESDLASLGLCEGTVEEEYCAACNTVIRTSVSDTCKWVQQEETTEDGYTICECSVCGGVKHESYTRIENDSPCYIVYLITSVYYVDGEEVLRGESHIMAVVHDYENKYELKGETCEDGVTVSMVCKNCGSTRSYETEGHIIAERETEVTHEGFCGATVNEGYCRACGEVSYKRINENCKWTGGKDDGDGFEEWTCYTCSAIKKYRYTEGEKDENCNVECSETYIYIFGTEEIYRYERSYLGKNHDYKETYALKGKTCEDGVTVNGVCKTCGAKRSYETKGHQIETRESDLASFNLCNGTINERYCTVCKTVTRTSVSETCKWVQQETTADGYTVWQCETCKGVKHQLIQDGEADENGSYLHTEICIYYVNDDQVFRYENTERYKSK